MKRTHTVEQLLAASRPEVSGAPSFVAKTMQAVERAAGTQRFADALGAASNSKKLSLLAKFKHLPKAAMLAVTGLAIATLSGTAYAAYRWLEPRIDIMGIAEFDNSRKYTVGVEDCGVVVGGASIGNGTKRYEVTKDNKLSDDQIKKVLRDSCQYQQTIEMMQKRWRDPLPPMNPTPGEVVKVMISGAGGGNVLNDPGVGTVASIQGDRITIAYTLYQRYKNLAYPFVVPDTNGDIQEPELEYFPEGKAVTHTLNLSPDVEVVHNGETVALGDLRKGDTVYFISEVAYIAQEGLAWGKEPISVRVARIIKMDVDPAYVLNMSLGNPNIVGGISLLGGCQGNGAYECIQPTGQGIKYDNIYVSGVAIEMAPWDQKRFEGNEKYFRKDIDFNKKETGKYFHIIEGRVARFEGNVITLASRGKVEAFTVEMPYDAVAAYNKTSKQRVRVGSLIKVTYLQKTDEDITRIKPGDLQGMSHVLRQMPDGSLRGY